MPLFHAASREVEISRNSMLLDTNVLVAAFDKDDPDHIDAGTFVREFDYQWLVPIAVVVESWGMLVGSRKNWQAGYELLAWINTPGTGVVVLPEDSDLSEEHGITRSQQLDCVDAMIVRTANAITMVCGLRPSLHIATFDTGDFLRLLGARRYRFNLFDMRSFDFQEIDGA